MQIKTAGGYRVRPVSLAEILKLNDAEDVRRWEITRFQQDLTAGLLQPCWWSAGTGWPSSVRTLEKVARESVKVRIPQSHCSLLGGGGAAQPRGPSPGERRGPCDGRQELCTAALGGEERVRWDSSVHAYNITVNSPHVYPLDSGCL